MKNLFTEEEIKQYWKWLDENCPVDVEDDNWDWEDKKEDKLS